MKLKFFLRCSVVAATTLGWFSSSVRAVVPQVAPVFHDPLNFTSAYLPFQPGGVKVFRGEKEEEENVVMVHSYLFQTRAFDWNETNVASRILREMRFENGQLAKFTDHYLAQATDGNIYSFGKSVTSVTNNSIASHDGSWLVGGPSAADPPETLTANGPALAMLAELEVRDVFKTEEVSPHLSTTARILNTNATIRTGVGVFSNVVRMIERPFGKPPAIRNYAREVGVITEKSHREEYRLISSTLLGPDLTVFTNIITSPTNNVGTNVIETPTPPETPTIPGTPDEEPETPAEPETPTGPEAPTEHPEIPAPPLPGAH